jgi:hypothetical protein
MTDTDATERLLSVLGEHVEHANKLIGDLLLMNVPGSLDDLEVLKASEELDAATGILIELRRRGDTLVHIRDLALLVDSAKRGPGSYPSDRPQVQAAVDRIESALGGT